VRLYELINLTGHYFECGRLFKTANFMVITTFLCFVTSNAWSNQLNVNKPKLTLYTENWPPYQSIDRQGTISGLSVDIIKKTLDSANWPYEIIVSPWARAIAKVHETPNSLIFSIARFPERELAFIWLVPLASVKSKLVAFNNEKKITINTISDINNYVLILKRGEASSTYFIENNLVNKNKIIWVTNSDQALHLLSIGRGDVYPVTENSFSEAVKKSSYALSQFRNAFDFKELDVDLYLASSNHFNPKLAESLKKLFRK